jgi:hypothetical protein
LLSGDSARQVTGAICPDAVSMVLAPSGEINFTELSACPPTERKMDIRNNTGKEQSGNIS